MVLARGCVPGKSAAPFAGGKTCRSCIVVRDDARKTDSPNAGYPMSAMAGALDVELEKVGYYRLGTGGRKPVAGDIRRARGVMFVSVVLGTGIIVFLQRWLASHGSRKKKGISKR